MPKRLLQFTRNEPARTLLLGVALMTFLLQSVTLFTGGPFPHTQINVAVVTLLCFYTMWSAHINNLKYMVSSSFWLSIVWLWSGISRLIMSPEPSMLLWGPFIIVSFCLGVVYIDLGGRKRVIEHVGSPRGRTD